MIKGLRNISFGYDELLREKAALQWGNNDLLIPMVKPTWEWQDMGHLQVCVQVGRTVS